jgi:DivIVA domain-containing protein
MTIERFRDVLGAFGAPVAGREVAEMLWLAAMLERDAVAHRPALPDRVAQPQGEPTHSPEDVHISPQPDSERHERPGKAGAEPPKSQPAAETDHPRPLGELHITSAGPSSGSNARSVLAPTVPMLRNALGVQRAVRPLKRRVASPNLSILDEAATANRIASQPSRRAHWLPVMVPALERWLSLTLIIDTAPAMKMWFPLARELRDALLGVGAFRDLRVWYMRDGQSSVEVVHSLSDGPGRKPSALVDPSGRQVIVVLSDCSGPYWWNERASAALHRWARGGPVAIFQPLPERLWHRTAAPALPGLATTSRAGAPNTELGFVPFDSSANGSPGSVPVPVLEPAPDWIADWARLVAGSGSQGLPTAITYVAGGSSGKAHMQQEEQQLSLEERVLRFRSVASREAAELAAHIAVSNPALPVMRLVQRQFLPTSRPAHLAEVLLSGLLRPVDAAQGMYEFIPGAREALLAILPRSESWHTANVLNRVSEAIERAAGTSAETFRAYASVAEGIGDYKLEAGVRPFALVSPEALRALSHAPIAVHTRTNVQPISGPVRVDSEPAEPALAEAGDPYSHDTPSNAAPSSELGQDTPEVDRTPEPGSPSLLQLLSPERQIVRFQGRESELEFLKQWLAGGGTKMLILTGAAGEGKTRLALALRTYLKEHAWRTIELDKLASPAAVTQQAGRPLCVLVDNADSDYLKTNEDLAETLADANGTTRFLLLARTTGAWWDALRRRIPDVVVTTEQLTLPRLMETRDLRRQAYFEAAGDFSSHLGLRGNRPAVPDLSDPDYGNALVLHGSALVATLKNARELNESAVGADEVEVWRYLANVSPRLFRPGFADALGNHGASLAARGDDEVALVATEEAIELYRQLIREAGAKYEPSLAVALSNLGEMLARLARFEEAFTATEEAIRIHRVLYRDRGSSHAPILARALWGYAWVRASGDIDIPPALAAAKECISIYEDLAKSSGGDFTNELVNARATYADLLGRTTQPHTPPARRSEAAQDYPTAEELEGWARWVENARFTSIRIRPGYDQNEVDRFLPRIRDTFLGQSDTPLTPADVRNVVFNTRRVGAAYDEEEVDVFLDEAEARVARMPLPEVTDDVATPPADADIAKEPMDQDPDRVVFFPAIDDPESKAKTYLSDREEAARWVEKYLFTTTRLVQGYDEREVDEYLDEIIETFLGRRKPPLRSAAVRSKRFNIVRFRAGYDQDEVEVFLDEASSKLSAMVERFMDS